MNYRNIIMVALVALIQACATPPTKSLENTKPLKEPIVESSETKAKTATSPTNDQSNSNSTGNPSPDTKTAEVEKQNKVVLKRKGWRKMFR